MSAAPGDRVVVPFGARDRVGVVVEVGDGSAVASARLKPVKRILDDAPRLSADWLEQMRFLSSYYQRPLGETVAGALPPRLRSLKPLPKKRKAAADADAPHAARLRPRPAAEPGPGAGHRTDRRRARRLSHVPAAWHHRQRQDRGLPAADRRGHRARTAGARAGAGNRPHAAAGSALPARVSRRAHRRAAQRARGNAAHARLARCRARRRRRSCSAPGLPC